MKMNATVNEVIANPSPGVITVWSDIACPWATLALATLTNHAQERDIEILIDHRAFPLELFNRRPTPKRIIDAEIVAIGALRPELEWQLWSRPEGNYPVTSLPAMAATQAAKSAEVGGLNASAQLDAALRKAFYSDQQCISMVTVIEDIARSCPDVDAGALSDRLSQGDGYAAVFKQWHVASSDQIQGSPQIFARSDQSLHNPGVMYHWTAAPGKGLPRFESYDPCWADVVLDSIRTGPDSAA